MYNATSAPIPQAGVIPYRWRRQQLEVLLITTRRRARWIIPKGKVDARLGMAGSACQEAYEEAGISGSLFPVELGCYQYQKQALCWTVFVFALSVDTVLAKWPEMGVRERRWFLAGDAVGQVHEPRLSALIAAFTLNHARLRKWSA